MKQIEYDNLNKSHLDSLTELDRLCFSLPWSRKLFENELDDPNKYYIVSVCNNEVVGYGGIATVLDQGDIMNIAVHPDFRRKQIATGILERLLKYAKNQNIRTVNLEVRESNINAYNLYVKFGFETVGKRKNYYSDNKETAVLMTKYLI